MPGKTICALALLLTSAAGTTAQAGLISFRSDDNHRAWTLAGAGGTITAAAGQADPYVLLVDDHNGVLPPVAFQVSLSAQFNIVPTGTVNIAGSVLYTYQLNGVFTLSDWISGAPLLTAIVSGGATTSLGVPGRWGSSGNLQGNDQGTSSVSYSWNGPDLPAYQMFAGQTSVGPDDFGFTMTSINSLGQPGVQLSPAAPIPASEWRSEGSFSGTAFFVPTPGVAGLIALGGLAATRRRR